MPSLIQKRGLRRYRGNVMVMGVTREKLFPDDSKKSYQKAVVWEAETHKALEKELSETPMVCLVVADWTEAYLNDVRDRFSKKTYQEKKSAFIRFAQEDFVKPELPIGSLTKRICQDFLREQFKTRSGYAANKDRKNLSSAWGWGRDSMDGWPKSENPFLAIQKFPEVRCPRYIPPEEDFWEVYNVVEGQDQIMLLAFLHLAARRGEIFGLTWSDVDFSNNLVRLWTRKRKGGHKEPDWLPMTTELREDLLGWWQERMMLQTEDKEHVFVCLDEKPFCEEYYGKPFKVRQHFMRRLCEKAKVKPFGFHAIRHLAASILYRKGYSLGHIQAVLRHKNPNTTADTCEALASSRSGLPLKKG